jgi:hypothetical protein
MSLTPREIKYLRTFVSMAQKLLDSIDDGGTNVAKTSKPGKAAKSIKLTDQTRTRRSGKELAEFRKLLKAERRRGVPVAELAKNHGISTAYIYQIG